MAEYEGRQKDLKANRGPLRVLVLGATGMLGHKIFEVLSAREDMVVRATAQRLEGLERFFGREALTAIIGNIDAADITTVRPALESFGPDVVINCIGIIKQLPQSDDPVVSIGINALFPHLLANACGDCGARLIHVSTDCVFSGKKGGYTEDDMPDVHDIYGLSKYLGEVALPHCITLRTSLIGHELTGGYGLVEWFLAQQGKVGGYANAIFSGFPSVEMARIIADYVIPNPGLSGLYHVSSDPISKYELLSLIARVYKKTVDIERLDKPHCDRSLDSARFRKAAGYGPPAWLDLVKAMHNDAADHKEI